MPSSVRASIKIPNPRKFTALTNPSGCKSLFSFVGLGYDNLTIPCRKKSLAVSCKERIFSTPCKPPSILIFQNSHLGLHFPSRPFTGLFNVWCYTNIIYFYFLNFN